MLQTSLWVGQTDCRHYLKVSEQRIKRCCGGKIRIRVKLRCLIHRNQYASECRAELCGYYEKKEESPNVEG